MTCNRYHLWAALECHAFSKAEAVLRFSAEEDGMWVQWQDYARLKAEVEHWQEQWHFVIQDNNKQMDEIAQLKAEVERLDTLCKQLMAQHSDISCENIMLRKAGDEMADFDPCIGHHDCFYNLVAAWIAAKEGKPSV